MKGQEWRNLRTKLTPTFTTGKMRTMFATLIDIGNQLNQVLDDETVKKSTDIKDLLTRFTTDVIASVAFGIEAKTLQDAKSEFRAHSEALLNPGLRTQLINLLFFVLPQLLKILRVSSLTTKLNIPSIFSWFVLEEVHPCSRRPVCSKTIVTLLPQ